MRIEHANEQGVDVVTLSGRFDAPAAPEAEQAFTALIQNGSRSVLVDFSGVDYISSGGIRVIIMLSKALDECGGRLKFCGLTPFVREVLDITHLSSRFDIYPGRAEGLAAFDGGTG